MKSERGGQGKVFLLPTLFTNFSLSNMAANLLNRELILITCAPTEKGCTANNANLLQTNIMQHCYMTRAW